MCVCVCVRERRKWKKAEPPRRKVATVQRSGWLLLLLLLLLLAALSEPQVIREKVATQMWASVSIDYRAWSLFPAPRKIFLSRRARRRMSKRWMNLSRWIARHFSSAVVSKRACLTREKSEIPRIFRHSFRPFSSFSSF